MVSYSATMFSLTSKFYTDRHLKYLYGSTWAMCYIICIEMKYSKTRITQYSTTLFYCFSLLSMTSVMCLVQKVPHMNDSPSVVWTAKQCICDHSVFVYINECKPQSFLQTLFASSESSNHM